MYGISRKAKKQLVKAYKAFFEKALEEKGGSNLNTEERKAIGQNVLDDILEASFKKLDIPIEEQENFKEEFEELIRKKFSDSLYDTSLKFTGKSFKIKS